MSSWRGYFCHQNARLEAQIDQVTQHSIADWHGVTISGERLSAATMDQLHVLSLGLNAIDQSDPVDPPLSKSPQNFDEESTSLVYRRVRRQVVARGLARHHGDPKAKEGHQRARTTRLQKQLAIIEDYRRTKARDESRLKKAQDIAELKHFQSATAIAPQSAVKFARKISLRQLPPSRSDSPSKNQQDDHSTHSISSPRATDIVAFAAVASRARAFSPRGPDSGVKKWPSPSQKDGSAKMKKESNGGRGVIDKSTTQVMCELKINKDIMMREHLVDQIHDTSSALDKLAADLQDLSVRKTKLENASQASAQTLSSGVGALVARRSSINGLLSPPKKEKLNAGSEDAPAIIDVLEELDRKLTDATGLVRRRVAQLNRLILAFQTTTIEIVETILEWRARKSQRIALSNIDKLHRYAWKHKQRHVKNYLAHIDVDLRDLFPSASMSLVLGIHTKYNPILLSRPVLESLGISDDIFVSNTFLTERRELISRDSTSRLPRPSSSGASSPTSRQAHAALYNTAKAVGLNPLNTPHVDIDRLRRCLEVILHERELERLAEEHEAAEKQRQATAYNPFEAIKVSGGVEDTIASVLKQKSVSEMAKVAEELRHRQEDATRAKEIQTNGTASNPNEGPPSLHVNPRRMRLLIEQRNELREGKLDCELRDTTSTWTKNKLKGQVMMRKMTIRHLEHQHARKIQRQFQAYRRRTQLLKNLTHFVLYTRHSVVSIQKLVRGFIAKRRYQEAKERHERQRQQHDAAKLIWSTYKRYKRRLRHRQSMSVEAVAQIQLIRVLQQQLDESSANEENRTSSAERYRRVGEERRRQRAAQQLRKRQELLELEAKKIAAATRIQSVYRMHSAKELATNLRGERRAHMSAVSAMMIQSKIRKFLKHQEKRRLKFRSDMERVNRSAVRIQSIYRGYNSRASLVVEFDDRLRLQRLDDDNEDEDDFDEEDDEQEEEESSQANSNYAGVLPPIVNSRPSTAGGSEKIDTTRPNTVEAEPEPLPPRQQSQIQLVSLPPIRTRAQSVEPSFVRKAQPPPLAVRRQTSNAMMKVELRLKEPTLGDDFEEAVTSSTTSQGGSFRRRFSRSGSGSSTSDASGGSFKSINGPPQG